MDWFHIYLKKVNKMKTENIETIGKWVLRIILVVAAIFTAIEGHNDIAKACFGGLVISFIWL